MIKKEKSEFAGSVEKWEVVAIDPCLSVSHVIQHVPIRKGTHQAKFEPSLYFGRRRALANIFCLQARQQLDRIPSIFRHPPCPRLKLSTWVVFTRTERVFQPPLFLTAATPHHGSRPLPSRSSTRFASWPRRVPLLPRSALSCVTATALPRSRL